MLTLTRQKHEVLVIGGLGSKYPEIRVMVVDNRDGKVKLGTEAPADCPVHRLEIFEEIQRDAAAWSKANPPEAKP
jgi:carbon storage regulator